MSLKRYRYSGKERDSLSGFYYYGMRYYAPWIGRWLSSEPAGAVDGLNLYAFVGGNPVGNYDPSGQKRKNAATIMSNLATKEGQPASVRLKNRKRARKASTALRRIGSLIRTILSPITAVFRHAVKLLGRVKTALVGGFAVAGAGVAVAKAAHEYLPEEAVEYVAEGERIALKKAAGQKSDVVLASALGGAASGLINYATGGNKDDVASGSEAAVRAAKSSQALEVTLPGMTTSSLIAAGTSRLMPEEDHQLMADNIAVAGSLGGMIGKKLEKKLTGGHGKIMISDRIRNYFINSMVATLTSNQRIQSLVGKGLNLTSRLTSRLSRKKGSTGELAGQMLGQSAAAVAMVTLQHGTAIGFAIGLLGVMTSNTAMVMGGAAIAAGAQPGKAVETVDSWLGWMWDKLSLSETKKAAKKFGIGLLKGFTTFLK